MRQVNAQAAVPVADNIIDLQLTFDMCTATPTPGCSNQPDPGRSRLLAEFHRKNQHLYHRPESDQLRQQIEEHVVGDVGQRAKPDLQEQVQLMAGILGIELQERHAG